MFMMTKAVPYPVRTLLNINVADKHFIARRFNQQFKCVMVYNLITKNRDTLRFGGLFR
jgi:hypothetical protein